MKLVTSIHFWHVMSKCTLSGNKKVYNFLQRGYWVFINLLWRSLHCCVMFMNMSYRPPKWFLKCPLEGSADMFLYLMKTDPWCWLHNNCDVPLPLPPPHQFHTFTSRLPHPKKTEKQDRVWLLPCLNILLYQNEQRQRQQLQVTGGEESGNTSWSALWPPDCCLQDVKHPSSMLVHLRDGSVWIVVRCRTN